MAGRFRRIDRNGKREIGQRKAGPELDDVARQHAGAHQRVDSRLIVPSYQRRDRRQRLDERNLRKWICGEGVIETVVVLGEAPAGEHGLVFASVLTAFDPVGNAEIAVVPIEVRTRLQLGVGQLVDIDIRRGKQVDVRPARPSRLSAPAPPSSKSSFALPVRSSSPPRPRSSFLRFSLPTRISAESDPAKTIAGMKPRNSLRPQVAPPAKSTPPT